MNYATADGTAVAPGDYTAGSGTLTFTPGVTTQTLTVPVIGDTLSEANETFFVNLSGRGQRHDSGRPGPGHHHQRRRRCPASPIGNVTVTEGNSGTVNATFTVSLSTASGQTVTVNYATADGTAVAPADYTAGSGTLTFNPGVTTQTLTVPVNGDTLSEANETFFVNLSGAGQRHDSGRPGPGHHHQRRRPCPASPSAT